MRYLVEYYDAEWVLSVTGEVCQNRRRSTLRNLVMEQMKQLGFPHVVVCFQLGQQELWVFCDTKVDVRDVPEPDHPVLVAIPFQFKNIMQMVGFMKQLVARLDSGYRITRATDATGLIHLSTGSQFHVMTRGVSKPGSVWQALGGWFG
jgi:hypothetical protein